MSGLPGSACVPVRMDTIADKDARAPREGTLAGFPISWIPTLVCALVVLSSRAGAGPIEAAIMAAMRLSDQPNYSWVTTVSDDARTYEILGHTIRGGYTRAKMPAVNSLRRQLGRGVTDTQIDFIFRGNVACVIETEHGWRRPDELPAVPLEDAAAPDHPVVVGLPGGSGSPPGPAAIRGSIVRLPRPAKGNGPRAYSNLQLGISHPHEDLGVIVASHDSLQVEDDVVFGRLTELAAKLLLVRDGQETITPVRAAGTFKLWRRGDLIVKYQVTLTGTLTVHLPTGRRTLEVSQISDTVLKEIGTTTFDVPEEARIRL